MNWIRSPQKRRGIWYPSSSSEYSAQSSLVERSCACFLHLLQVVANSVLCRPQYYQIYKHKEVLGISVLFMIIDLLGGIFNDLSLAFKDEFDVVAGVTYSLVVVSLLCCVSSTLASPVFSAISLSLQVMDGIVILCAVILNPLANRRRKQLAAAAAADASLSSSETATRIVEDTPSATMKNEKREENKRQSDIEKDAA